MFLILQKEPDRVRVLFRSDDVFSAWELRKYKNIIQRVLENFKTKLGITARGIYNEFLPINIGGGE